MCSTVYLSNVPTDCSKIALEQLLRDELSLTAANVNIKQDCVSVEFTLPSEAEIAVEKLKGFSFHGHILCAEMSGVSPEETTSTEDLNLSTTASNGSNDGANCSIVFSHLSPNIDSVALEQLCVEFGKVLYIEKDRNEVHVGDGDDNRECTVSFATKQHALDAVNSLNNTMLGGSTLHVKLLDQNDPTKSKPPVRKPFVVGRGQQFCRSMGGGCPLRMLVQSEMVGAIIGRSGHTIREITQQTRARVDVHRKENVGAMEKAITVFGNPENCSNACRLIIGVISDESKGKGKESEVVLKILAHNSLVGRIIGKQGTTIKKIMEDTDTKITVSSINDLTSYNMERVIVITGATLDNLARAEVEISGRLRSAYESDFHAIVPHASTMFPVIMPHGSPHGHMMPHYHGQDHINHRIRFSGHFAGVHRGNALGHMGGPGGYGNGPVSEGALHQSNHHHHVSGAPPAAYMQHHPGPRPHIIMRPQGVIQSVPETVFMYIPNSSVGAIIGTKGTHIRYVIKNSGASVKIAQNGEADEEIEGLTEADVSMSPSSTAPPVHRTERKVTIVGIPESQWKAQYLIYEKLKEEGFSVGFEEVSLTIEILVPSNRVGRIIGKGGANVRELQRVTGSLIKLPDQTSAKGEETPVHIIGAFYGSQSAQRRLRSMVQLPVPMNNPHGVYPHASLNNGGPPAVTAMTD